MIIRLGHREQKDEWLPRLVEVFQKKNILPPNAIISAGAANSACTAGTPSLNMRIYLLAVLGLYLCQ